MLLWVTTQVFSEESAQRFLSLQSTLQLLLGVSELFLELIHLCESVGGHTSVPVFDHQISRHGAPPASNFLRSRQRDTDPLSPACPSGRLLPRSWVALDRGPDALASHWSKRTMLATTHQERPCFPAIQAGLWDGPRKDGSCDTPPILYVDESQLGAARHMLHSLGVPCQHLLRPSQFPRDLLERTSP